MENKLKISGIISLVSGIVSAGFLIYNIIAFELIRFKINSYEELSDSTERLALLLGIGLLVSFFFHISAIITLALRFQVTNKISKLGFVTMFACIISFICIIGDIAALSDIGKQYEAGLSTTMEWLYLYLSLIPHGLFHVLQFIILYFTFRLLKISEEQENEKEEAMKDEIIFIVAQYIGILCGVIGLGFLSYVYVMQIPPAVLKHILPVYCPFFLIPYGFICLYWIIIKRKERLPEVYDEKQWRDVSKAGLTTLLSSIPCMALLYALNLQSLQGIIGMIWFPFYLFLILVLISGSTLYFSNRV